MPQNIAAPWIYYVPQAITTVKQYIAPTVKTRLGVVGETLIGPAFQPTLIESYTEFQTFFGDTNIEKDGITNFPRYELPYIAKLFLNQSKGLFVTRVLGFSGYDAGYSWAITLESNFDVTTVVPTVTGGTYPTLFTFTADTQNVITNLTSNDVFLQSLWDNGIFKPYINNLQGSIIIPSDSNYTAGTLNDISYQLNKFGSIYSGLSINNFYLNSYNEIPSIGYSGTTSGITVYHSGATYSGVDDQVVALLKSRATYGADEILNFKLSGGSTSINFNTSVSGATTNVYDDFELNWMATGAISGSSVVSFDNTKTNYIGKVLGKKANNGTTAIYAEEIYDNIIRNLNNNNKIKGIKLSLVDYTDKFSNYKEKYQPSVTPWVVSQIKGSNINKLFRFWTKGDGGYTANLLKVTISNIRLANSQNVDYDINNPDKYDDYKFDVSIRPIDNPDTNFMTFTDEVFTKCSMNPKSVNYIGKLIGTRNGDYPSKSNYVTVELNEDDENTVLSFPAGFLGYPIRDYNNPISGTALSPYNLYKTVYNTNDIISNNFLGLGDSLGFDKDMFIYKGIPNSTTINEWTGLTKGFHMDINATGATIDGVDNSYANYEFEVGNAILDDEQNVFNTQYELLSYRKFTLMPYGGFDGWDVYRRGKTNSNYYSLNGNLGILGELSGNFKKITLTDNTVGLTSDYYAFLEGIWTFKNTDAININLFATPGLDIINHNNLIEAGIELVENLRADSLYVITTPDVDASDVMLDTQDVVNYFDSTYDTTYATTYWPWVKIGDDNGGIWLPPTASVLSNMAKNDNASGGNIWDAVAGVNRGDIDVLDIRMNENNEYLSTVDINNLYNNRINPLIKVQLYQEVVTYSGFKIWGNKTLSTTDYLTNRVNVRRLMLEVRDLIINTCKNYLFEPNDAIVKRELTKVINPLLASIKDGKGISEFKLVFTDTPESIDKGELSGKIFLKPIKSLEYIVFAFSMIPSEDGFGFAFNQE